MKYTGLYIFVVKNKLIYDMRVIWAQYLDKMKFKIKLNACKRNVIIIKSYGIKKNPLNVLEPYNEYIVFLFLYDHKYFYLELTGRTSTLQEPHKHRI